MGKTVAELDATMSMSELRAWQAFDRVDPIGGYRGDLQAAKIMQHIAIWSGYCKDVPSLRELLPINPNPLTVEQQQAADEADKAARQEAYTSALIATLQRRTKANNH